MKKLFVLAFALLGLCLSSCNEEPAARPWNDGMHLIPLPAEMQMSEGDFTLSSSTALTANNEEAKTVATFFAEKMGKATGYSFKVADEVAQNAINICVNPDAEIAEEGYKLSVTPAGVNLEAKTAAGAFYGMQTFLQLLPAEIESPEKVTRIAWTAPACEICDEPRYSYRGFHVDPCRHFWTVEETKKIIDAMSMFKTNRMHWHITEDQGWRIEVKKYPKLTEVGATRIEGDGTEYGGFYTQEEVKDIVAYAAARHIEVIPEIDLPGHMAAAIVAYPELACNHAPKLQQPRIVWGVEDVVMCPGKEEMFNFLQDLFDEIVPLFPSKYFHVGGDECPKKQWETCPDCQARIKAEGIKAEHGHTAEQGLQTYVLSRVSQMLAKHGKQIIGWDEILEGGLEDGNSIIMSWRGTDGGIAAATQGHDAIMSPSSEGLYLDNFQGDPKISPVAIGGYSTLKRVYSYNPTPDTLTVQKLDHHIIGVQGNNWSEYMQTAEVMEYRMFPRMLAVAEVGWTPNKMKNYDDFERRLNNALVRLDFHDINYYIPQPEQPNGSCNFVAFTDKASLEFTTTYPHTMIYTLDGTDPKAGSTEYTAPIEITETTTLKICTLLPSGKTSPIRTITVEKQELSPATEVAEKNPGLKMKKTYGTYLNAKELEKATEWEELTIPGTFQIRSQEPTTEDMREAKYYSAIAEGYVEIAEDGVYYISSNNDEVWIDGKLLVNNAGEVKRFSHNDSSMALAKGLHKIKIVFCGNLLGGWPSQWDDASVKLRKSDAEKFVSIKPEQLFY